MKDCTNELGKDGFLDFSNDLFTELVYLATVLNDVRDLNGPMDDTLNQLHDWLTTMETFKDIVVHDECSVENLANLRNSRVPCTAGHEVASTVTDISSS